MINLLAKDGTRYNERQGYLGRIMHDFSKWMMRRAVDKIAKRMAPVIKYKMQTGWCNPEISLLYEDMSWMIGLDEKEAEKTKIGGFTGGKNDVNRRFFTNLRDIICTTLDEDTHYNLRLWVLMHRMHEQRWKEAYEVAMNRSNAFFNYREIYEAVLARHDDTPLPQLEDEEKRLAIEEDDDNELQN